MGPLTGALTVETPRLAADSALPRLA